MGSETLPSACYILFDESSIPFYSTSNGYNNQHRHLHNQQAGLRNRQRYLERTTETEFFFFCK